MSDQQDDQQTEDFVAEDSETIRQPQLSFMRRNAVTIAVAAAVIGLLIGLLIGTLGSDDIPPSDPTTSGDAHEDHADGEDETVWTCSMHPQIRSDEPGQCPICGMDLIPVSEGGDGVDESTPARVTLNERAKVLAEVRTAPVRRLGDQSREIRLLGRVDHDETKVRTVTSWTAGRIDRLHVATTGEKVRAGQTIATIYSPEIYTAHRDLLQANRQLETLSSGMAFARDSARATVEAARQKLRLLGVSNQEIASMEKSDEPWTQVRIRTRFGGTVIDKLVNEGAYIQAGTGIYRVADLEQLWVQLDAYESDLPRLKVGQNVNINVDALPERTFEGTIAFIDPVIDQARRTARVRVEVDNDDGELRPGMFAEAVVQGGRAVGEAPPLVIPATAPLFSGRRSVVYVEVPNTERPTYEAREVNLGPKAGNVYPVLSGLQYGESVIVHGAFAIDADLQIRGGASMMTRPDDETRGPELAMEVDQEFRSGLQPIVQHYLNLQTALADDDLEAALQAADALAKAAERFEPDTTGRATEAWIGIRADIQEHARHMSNVRDLNGAREAFDGFSRAVSSLLSRFGNPTDADLRVAYCPMAFENRGAEWIQATDDIDNSYFGDEMLGCGEIRQVIPSGAYLDEPQEPAGEQRAPAGGHQH